MRKLFLTLLPLTLFGEPLQPDSMLSKADWIAKTYSVETAKAPPPLLLPQPQSALDTASVWFSIDLEEIAAPALQTLNDEMLWDHLREIGVQGVYLKGLKKGGEQRTGLGLDPKWGSGWDCLVSLLQKKGIVAIGDSLGNSTGVGPDFFLALKNFGDYPGLYHLVEIDNNDWKLLPTVREPKMAANVSWLKLQELQKKGYVPEQFTPYVKQSSWNATAPIKCVDGKVRRWIYLKENELDPVIDWLNPTFAGCRIAAADVLDSVYNLSEQIIQLDAAINVSAKETLSLVMRKAGAFSVLENKNGLDEMKDSSADLMTDTLTRPALLHALMAQDAGALKLMYRLMLQEGIETKRLVHVLQPFDQFSCDWAELALHPRRQFQYYEEILTGEALRTRLLREDAARIGENGPNTWPTYCAYSLNVTDFNKHRDDISAIHQLLAFFYMMQPGVFSFSASDLLGTLSKQQINLMAPNENTLYASLPGQFRNQNSFAMQLRKMIGVRRDNSIESGKLIGVPETQNRGLMILVHQLKNGMLQLLALNFSPEPVRQALTIPAIANTSAIDLMTSLNEPKPLDASTIYLTIPALSGKVILFQTKYYD